MQQVDDPPSLPVGTEVSAKYKGAFCEAKVSKVVRNIKVKVAYKQGLGSGIVSDDAIKAAPGQLRVGTVIEVRHPDRKEYVEATITKIQDCSQYTVVFDDGDITTLRRTALCLKSGRHFNESETLDQLPLTHPEHFGNPVVGGRRGRRRGQLNDGSSDDDDESDAKEVVNEKEENIGKVVCVETESKKKDKEKWFPALVVAPTAQATVRIRVKDEYLVRSFKDGRYYTVPKKEANEFTREMSTKQDGPAIQAALEFLDSSVLPAHWDRDSLFGLSNLTSDDDGEIDSDSSDDEPHEEKDLFVAQLYKYMDDRGTPLNKVPSIQSRDVDLYRLFRAVQKRGGYNRVTAKNQWKLIAVRLGFTPCTLSVMNLVKQAYKKFLQPYGDFHRKLGCSMLMPSRNSNRSKGRSLVRANSVASPKPADTSKMESISKLAVANQTAAALASSSSSTSSAAAAAAASTSAAASTPARAASTASQSAAEESENTSESSVVVEPVKKQRKASAASSGKVKSLVEKYEEKTTEKSSSAAAAASTSSAAAAAASAATSSSSASASNANSSSNSASASTASTAAAAAANTAAANATTAAAAAAAAAASASSKDAEADVPLSKIRAAAVTRNSIDKEPNAGGSNAASKAATEAQRSRDVSPTAAATAAAGASTSSSSASSSTSKKEKHQQRKQVEKGDEKRGKRKKDETSVEKIDTGDFIVGIGDKLKVNYHEKKSPSSHGSTYEAKVIEISVQRGVPMYLVHYTGWNNRYDEWVPRERIAENLTKGSKQKTRTISTSSANSGSGGNSAQAAGSSSAAAGGSGGGGGSGSNGNGGNGNAATAGSGLQPKDGPGKSAGGAATVGGSSEQQHQQQQQPPGGGSLQSLGKTPASTPATPTLTSSKRGRGRSDSMPPRSTTPSSVASNSSRTKSPAAAASQSQLKQKRATRTLPHATSSSSSNQHQPRRISASASVSANVSDASMPSDTDTDSDEPVRRPKRLNAKEQQQLQQQQSFASKSAKATAAMAKKVASARLARNSGSDDSEDEEDEMPPSKQQAQSTAQQPSTPVQRQRAGNRALSSGSAATTTAAAAAAATTAAASTAVAASKGRDYDLSEIRSELKGFQPQLLDRKDAAIKSEPGEANTTATSATATVAAGKQEPKTGSSTEQSSETDSYLDEDSQSSEKVDYRIKSKSSLEKTKLEPSETIIKKEQAEQLPIKHETSAGDSKPSAFKAEPKEEPQSKPFHSGADIKPTTASTSSSLLIAPARFTASGSKCTSVIVEKPLRKTEAAGGGATTTSTAAAAAAGATGSSISIFKKMELLKKGSPVAAQLESPAVCSPSSSSSSSSSFCSSSNSSAITTVSVSSSSATRSLPDMSKLEISSGITATASAVAGKESKYSSGNSGANSSSSSNINVGSSNIASGIKLLSSDVYEFKDTEPFEFEKRISPMTSMVVGGGSSGGVAASVIAGATPTSSNSSNIAGNFDTQRKHNLKLSAMMQSMADVTTTTTTTGAAASAAATIATATTATSTVAVAAAASSGFVATPCKLKKRGSPLKEATLTAPDNKPKMPKLEQQQQQQPAMATTSGSSVKATPAKVPPTTATAATVGVTQLTPGHATPFDVLRKSPSFNLNITALNEELAQTVQETTRVLTDALQPPTTPATPPANAATVGATIVATPTAGVVAISPKLSTPPQAMGVAKTTQQQQQQSIVGSPFMETRNVFELSTSNEGSGYSSGESNKDNKLEKLENVKILLAGKPGPFDLDAVKYEQKPSSIADKVLKAISQKKEEVEQSKSKSQADTTSSSSSNAAEKETEPATQQQQQQQPQPSPQTLPQAANLKQLELSSLLNLQLISEPLKILTPGVLSDLNHRTSSSNSPETKSILDASLTAKNSELTETIQKLECAIQQRKTPVAGQSLASSTAGTPPVTATAPQSFSDESMDSTDSEQRLVIEDVMVEEPSIISDLKSPMSTASDSLSGSAPVKLEATGSSKQQLSGVAAPIALKPMPRLLSRTPTAGGAAAVAAAAAAAAATPPGTISPIMPIYVPIVLPEIPASVVVALRHSPSAAGGSSSGISSPASPKTEPTKVPPSPLAVADVEATAASSTAQQQLLLKPCPAQLSPMQQMDASVVTAGAELAKGNSLFSTTTTTSSSAAVASSPLPRPFVLQPVKEKDMPMHVSPAASSPLISDPSHNEAAINLLCEETIPGSPAPIYSTKDEPIVASSSSSNVIATAIPTTPAAAVAVSSASSVLSISGITPLTPEPAPRSPRATHVQPTISAAVATAAPAATTAAATTGAATAGAAASAPSPSRSSPESPASQDDSSEETGSSSMLSAAKKYAESVLESNTSLAGRRKRPRTKASDANASNATATASSSSAAAGQLSSSEMQKRRRQHLSNMRKTTATTAGSDTDDNSDNVVTTQRQSGRQQLLPQAQQQQLQQQQQQQQHQQLQQQQQQLQQQQQVVVTASGVRPCPYNFLVELDPSLSAEQCILILRKQIQDLRKAYNSIKGELAVIDRRRKKLRRREREKKQHQQLQGGQQGKVCT
ncbi:hypothetical protein KR215_004414 [Drosophila sulfurigaster]|nr:hypothetical protein KR215_004414 [Drosophila sulfurigaster]